MKSDKAWSTRRATAALELRMCGYTYNQIAFELGYASKSGAYNAVNRLLTSRRDQTIDKFRIETLAHLDYLQAQIWAKVHQGDRVAIEISRKIAKQRIQVLGHDGLIKPKATESIPKKSLYDDHEHFHML